MIDPAPSKLTAGALLPLNALLIEDCEADAELLLVTLRRGGYDPRWKRVDTATALSAALQRRNWDIITCDWVMPRFGALDALALIRECGCDVPVIVVSGQVGEEFAVTAMKAGAHDFVSKHRLARLCPAVARELTESRTRRARKQAEEALYLSQFAMDYAGEAIFWVESDGRFLYVNHTASQRLGCSREQLLMMHVWDIDPRFTRQRWQAHWEEIKAHGTLTFESQHRRSDGSTFPVEVTVKYLQHRGQECAVGLVRDVSERKQAETDLREREAALSTMIQSFDGLIYTCSQDYRIEFMNRQLIERTGHEAIGERCYKVLHERDDVCPWCVNERVFQGEVVRWEVQSPKDQRWYYIVNTPLRHTDGSMSKQALILDITDRKRMEEGLRESEARYRRLNAELEQRVRSRTTQLEAANRELEAFGYSVSHDLRAPLRAIDGFSTMLLNRYAEQLDARGCHYLQRLQANAEAMTQLIEALLSLSRVTRADMQHTEVNLSRLAEAIAAELRAGEPARPVRFTIAPGLRTYGDPDLLRVVLQNLLENAWKYTSRHATACIDLGVQGPGVGGQGPGGETTDPQSPTPDPGIPIYFVRDDGAGFDPAYAAKLFGAFQRLHSLEEFDGTGIGLATVQRIIHRHNGRIWAEGAVEQGATFYFTLAATGADPAEVSCLKPSGLQARLPGE